MVVRKCHLIVAAFLMCLLSCKANDSRVIESDAEHRLILSSSSGPEASVTAPNVKPDPGLLSTSSTKPQAGTPEPTISHISTPSAVPQVETSKPHSDGTLTSTAKAELPNNDPTLPPIPTPSTVPSDPDKPTEKPTSTTTVIPPTSPTTKPSTTASPLTTVIPPTSTTPASSTSVTTPTTVSPPSTTPNANKTTVAPTTTPQPAPHHNRQFDGPSFIGGIVLATGLMAIGFVAFKFYKARTERNYHTL